MSESARSILKHLYKEGRMTEWQYDKIDRNLKDRPCGKWLISSDRTRACCPFCHNKWTDAKEIALLDTAFRAKNFCEYCGADMRGGEAE